MLMVAPWAYKEVGLDNQMDLSVFGRFDLAALCGCHTLNVCYVMLIKAGENAE